MSQESSAEHGHPRYVAAAALLIGIVAFGFRALAHRRLINDHYMHLTWAQQLLSGELPGRDFVDPGMPLNYSLSAAVQYFWPGPFSEVIFTSAMLGIAAGVTYVVIVRLTGSVGWAVAGALFELAFLPRLYSYPKILVPSITLMALLWYVTAPNHRRLWVLGLWTAASTLLRYDLGAYAGTSLAVGLAVFHRNDRLTMVRALSSYLAAFALIILPYVAYVEWAEGLTEHIREGIEFGRTDARQILPGLPRLSASIVVGDPGQWSDADSAALLFYVAYFLALMGLLIAARRARDFRQGHAAVLSAGVVLLLWYVTLILRDPIYVRIRDLATVFAIFGAVTCSVAAGVVRALVARRRRVSAVCASTLVLALSGTVAATVLSVGTLTNVYERVLETRVPDGWTKVIESVSALKTAGSEWPWGFYWPTDRLPEVVRYIEECTAPTDRLFLTWPAPEYYYFTRRSFGAGNSYPSGSGQHAEDRMITRLSRQRVPVVLINESRRHVLTRLDKYLQQRYAPVGRFTLRDGSDITIAVDRSAHATRSFGPEQWPCGFDPARPLLRPATNQF